MSDDDPLAGIDEALAQVVEIGHSAAEAELGAAVSRHVSGRAPSCQASDPETVAALRALAAKPPVPLPQDPTQLTGICSLVVNVDFNALLGLDGLKSPQLLMLPRRRLVGDKRCADQE